MQFLCKKIIKRNLTKKGAIDIKKIYMALKPLLPCAPLPLQATEIKFHLPSPHCSPSKPAVQLQLNPCRAGMHTPWLRHLMSGSSR